MSNPFAETEHYEADLLGYSARHELRLLAEVKAGPYWAAKDLSSWIETDWERFFLEMTGTLFPVPAKPTPTVWFAGCYFLLATPTQLALWQPGPTQFRRPDCIADATQNLDLAIDTQRVALSALPKESLQRVVMSWLFYSIATPQERLRQQAVSRWLVDAGLHTALYQGEIVEPAGDKTGIYATVR